MSTYTLAPDLKAGDNISVGNNDSTVTEVEIITPGPYAGYEYDDFRGSGQNYVRIAYTYWSYQLRAETDSVKFARLTDGFHVYGSSDY
jgi:hypothetical protein